MDIKPFLIIGAIFVALVVLYYIVSPYQNCMREAGAFGICLGKTSW